MVTFVWNKPVLTFYRDRREQPEREPFAVVQTRKLTVTRSESNAIDGEIQDFFGLMGNLDYISSEEGKNDRFIVCWFEEKEDDFNKAFRRLGSVKFPITPKYESDERGKRTYNATFTAQFGKLA